MTADRKVVSWSSPSNIAIVKYWGKHGLQLPCNPSISFTLSECHSKTSVAFTPKSGDDIDVKLYFHGEREESFEKRAIKFLGSLHGHFSFLNDYSFEIRTENTFPHSAGIASSASGMSALALCLCSIERELGADLSDDEFYKKSNYIARLGSGSACRSVYGGAVMWGDSPSVEQSSNEYAVELSDVNPVFSTYHDSILIVSSGEKSVSSSAGHALMNGHPYAEARFKRAHENIDATLRALRTGHVDLFGNILEEEALGLHGLMMTSDPSFILMAPNSLEIISRVREYRKRTGNPLYFTLDAGPNIHLLYPHSIAESVSELIETELKPFLVDGLWIDDRVGQGPKEWKE